MSGTSYVGGHWVATAGQNVAEPGKTVGCGPQANKGHTVGRGGHLVDTAGHAEATWGIIVGVPMRHELFVPGPAVGGKQLFSVPGPCVGTSPIQLGNSVGFSRHPGATVIFGGQPGPKVVLGTQPGVVVVFGGHPARGKRASQALL